MFIYAKYWRFIKWHILEILGEFTGTWLLLASWSNSFPSPAVEDDFIQILKAESEPQHLFLNSTFLLSGLIGRYFWVTGRTTAQKWFNHAGGTLVSGRSQVVGVKWWMSQSRSQSAQVTPGLTQRVSLYSWGRRIRERIRTKKGRPDLKFFPRDDWANSEHRPIPESMPVPRREFHVEFTSTWAAYSVTGKDGTDRVSLLQSSLFFYWKLQ